MKGATALAVVLVAGGMLSVLNSTLLSPVLPVIMGEMSVTASTAQWLITGYTLVNAVVVPISAFLMGRFDTRKLFAVAMIALTFGSALCAVPAGFVLIMAGRVLQAVAAGILMPLIVTVLMIVFPLEKRGSVMGIYNLAVCASPAVGPVFVGALADTVGWRIAFVASAALSVILLAVGMRLIVKEVVGKRATLDAPSVIVSAFALLALLGGFSMLGDGDALLAGGLVVVGFAGVVWFARRQLGMREPYLDVSIVRQGQYRIGTLSAAVMNCVLPVLTIVLPLYLQNVCGASATESGLALAPVALGAALASIVAGRAYDSLGARKVTVAAAVVAAAGIAWLLMLGPETPVITASLAATLVAVGTMAANVPLSTWSMHGLDAELLSHGNALASTVRQIISSLVPAAAVSAMEMANAAFPSDSGMPGVDAAYILCLALVVAGMAFFLVGTVRNTKRTP